MDILELKSVSALRKAVKDGDDKILEFLKFMNIQIGYLKHEKFNEPLFCRTIDRSVVYPRLIIEKIILSQAKGVIFVHNHPSGSLIPSKKDIEVTLEIQELLDKVYIKLLDHYIISETENFSFYENGLTNSI